MSITSKVVVAVSAVTCAFFYTKIKDVNREAKVVVLNEKIRCAEEKNMKTRSEFMHIEEKNMKTRPNLADVSDAYKRFKKF